MTLRKRLQVASLVPVLIGLAIALALCVFLRGWLLLVLLLPATAVGWSLLHWLCSPSNALDGMRAQRALPTRHADLIDDVRRLADRAGVSPHPQVWISASPVPNACAVRTRPGSLVCVTEGALALLSPRELRGVLGHEISHITNADSAFLLGHRAVTRSIALILGLVAVVVALVSQFSEDRRDRRGGLATAGFIMALGGIAGAVLFLAASRCRERLADHDGADLTGDPFALAAALTKLDRGGHRHRVETTDGTTAATCIINPFQRWFSSHPTTERRVRWLRDQAGEVSDYEAEQWFDLLSGVAVGAD